MNGFTVSRDVGRLVASYIEERRREIVASVVRSPVVPRLTSSACSDFAYAFIDKLRLEFESGDPNALLAWADTQADPARNAERARIVAIACAVISANYVADRGQSEDIARYLASRASEIEHRFHAARPLDPLPLDAVRVASRDDVVSSLISAMDVRDRATCEHSRAVGMWCNRIAKKIGMSPEDQALASLAGTLHDVGKIATPSEILLKVGPLDAAEWDEMRAHAQIGAKMLERIPSLEALAVVARTHHERMDGKGYPDGLAGDAIPLLARVVAVADSFHAMISKRPYRNALPVAVALDELRAGSGTQWDPQIVDAMLAIVQPSRAHRALRAARGARRALISSPH